jgi:hypothetical protein
MVPQYQVPKGACILELIRRAIVGHPRWQEGHYSRFNYAMRELMLWRVHPRTVNPIPLGKHCRFDSYFTHQTMDRLGIGEPKWL